VLAQQTQTARVQQTSWRAAHRAVSPWGVELEQSGMLNNEGDLAAVSHSCKAAAKEQRRWQGKEAEAEQVAPGGLVVAGNQTVPARSPGRETARCTVCCAPSAVECLME
jgi:hypothetical protein